MAARARAAAGGDAPLAVRLKWLLAIRLAVFLSGLAAVAFFDVGDGAERFSGSALAPYLTLTFACCVNVAYLIALRAGAASRTFALGQVGLDVLVIAALTYFLGPQSAFGFFYFAVVIGASMVSGSADGFIAATLSAAAIFAVSWLYYRVPVADLPGTEHAVRTVFETQPGLLLGRVFFFSLGLYTLAFLSGKLAEEVSRVRIVNDEILQNMAGGVVAIDRLGAIAFMNPQAVALLGLPVSPAEARQRRYPEVLPKELSELVQRALVDEERVDQELKLGETLLRVGISRLQDARRQLRGVAVILNDLGFRLKMEQLSQRAERFRALLEMSAGMAHEIRNPLASIRGAAQELEGVTLPGEDDRKLLKVVIRESDRLDRIISDFLEYASDRPMKFSLVNLPDVLREVADALEARDTERRMDVKLELPRTLVCRGDPDKLKQVFLNLGLNALESIGTKGRLTIRAIPARVSGGSPVEGAHAEFEDTGGGIAAENLGRIFDPFFTTKPRGTGMGLAIARKIVQGHDGTIVAESSPGRGSTFRVWLPAG